MTTTELAAMSVQQILAESCNRTLYELRVTPGIVLSGSGKPDIRLGDLARELERRALPPPPPADDAVRLAGGRGVMDWRPIATAPRDGETPVLVWYPKAFRGKGGHYVALWQDGAWWACVSAFKFEPTHWQPLPEPPARPTTPEGD